MFAEGSHDFLLRLLWMRDDAALHYIRMAKEGAAYSHDMYVMYACSARGACDSIMCHR